MISHFWTDLQSFHFLQNALFTSVTIGIVAGVLGSFIILRGMSLMGDAISHSVLPGVAVSFLIGIHPVLGAIAFGIFAALLITTIQQHSVIKSDTAIGITFSTFLALGSSSLAWCTRPPIYFIFSLAMYWPCRTAIWC